MKNWKSEFQINYHVNFLMEDATMITKYEGIVIEAENEKQVQDLVQSYFKTNPESFVEYPEKWSDFNLEVVDKTILMRDFSCSNKKLNIE